MCPRPTRPFEILLNLSIIQIVFDTKLTVPPHLVTTKNIIDPCIQHTPHMVKP